MKESNSLRDSDFLRALESVSRLRPSISTTAHQPSESQARSDGAGFADAPAAPGAEEESRLNQELQQACLATGATGAAIALFRGEEIVCHAATGPNAPDTGISLDPRTGLSGSCIQTRQLQLCNDAETDPRVNPAACRQLGVRSIAVLPLLDGDELFGVLEILSPRPNAFSQSDLDTLQPLTDRIVKSRRQDWEAPKNVLPKEPESSLHTPEEVAPQDRNLSPEPDSGLLRRERISRTNDVWTPVLGLLVIGAAIALGTLVGWRAGWQRASLGAHVSAPPPSPANALSKTAQTNHTASSAQELPSNSEWAEECGPGEVGSSAALPPGGGLTVCQDGRVIFRMPPSPRAVKTIQRSSGLKADSPRQ